MNIQCTLLQLTSLLSLFPILHLRYVSSKRHENKDKFINSVLPKSYKAPFGSDWDIRRYLDSYGREMMLWTCKNIVQHSMISKPLPKIELYCEGIGRMRSFSWHHNGKKIFMGKRYGQIIMPHFENNYYSMWIDFTLTIYNATQFDSGKYIFRLKSPRGEFQQQSIFVDVSQKYKLYHHNKHYKSLHKSEYLPYSPP